MRFRDLGVFNLALLAKRGWRLLQFPDSLVAKVMREKYFPSGSFLEAQLGRRPSYTWRSIFQANEVLEEGLVWRVGNGEKINIWGDKWLLTPQLQSPVNVLPTDARVLAFIDSDTGWWNFPSIRPIFTLAEADSICNMVLSPLRHPDRLVWTGSKNGLFSVKSAYHMEKQRREHEIGESSKASDLYVFWKAV